MLSLTPDLVLCAYAIGLFPMANDREDPTVQWIEPRRRGIIPLDRFRVPRSLRKTMRREAFTVRTDTAFEKVIRACAEPRPDRPKTWINEQLIEVYCDLFARGHAHSVECWRAGRLVGGLYGVSIGAAFFGESMFTRQRDASKVALVHLVERLRRGGYQLLDTQFVTDHLRRFGADEVSRDEYRGLLRAALATSAEFDPRGRPVRRRHVPPILMPASTLAAYESPQSITQTS